MNPRWNSRQVKRIGAAVVTGSMLLQVVTPAFATINQVPGLYVIPPDANVMFTLDDSLSMLSDAIPDFVDDQVGMPNATGNSGNSDALSGQAGQQFARFPGMWKSGTGYWATTYYRSDNAIARYMRSSSGNPLYYNPNVTYSPWPQASNDKTLNANATTTAVNIDPTNPFSTTFTRDLTTRVNESGTALTADDQTKNFWPATYYVYTGTTPLPVENPNTALNVATSFTKVEIKPLVLTYARAASRTDCTGAVGAAGCTYAQELQNFANWLQYYRSRMLMAKGGVSAAFAQQGTNLRVGFGTINDTVRQGVQSFATTRRTSFYTDLYGRGPSNGGTPLRSAMNSVGQYFQRTNAGNPWSQDPTSSSVGTEYTCRRSFHMMSTDGFWNDNNLTGGPAANNDSFSGRTPAKPDGTTYLYSDSGSATDPLVGKFNINPYADGNSNTLADVAAYYWKTDLRTDLANEVPSSVRDPAFWQHVVTYTIGFGVSGTGGVKRTSDGTTSVPSSEPSTSPFYNYRGLPWISTQDLRDALITNRTPLTWTTPVSNGVTTGDDLVHASMDGHGKYFSASDPNTLKVGLASALAEAADNPSSLANVVTQSAQVSAGSAVYQATYNPSQWYGRFYAFPQAANGTVDTTPSNALWEASNKMPTPDNRNIFTWNPTLKAGSLFTWATLTATQQSNLGTSTVLDYLRGSSVNEAANGGTLRDRSRYTVAGVTGGILGDIVNGSPIKGPSDGSGYDRLPSGAAGQSTYAAYRSASSTTLDNMRNTLFLGANDGMLHAFDRNTGIERFGYVPNSVYSVPRSLTGTELKLKMLSDPGYQHRFTVDGPPQIADAYIGPDAATAAWQTVLVGSTGAGSRAVFGMNITDPSVSATAFGTSKLLWEFSEADNADMGYVTSYPHVARMRDGTWVAIFGNGYDSTNGQAKLFVLNLLTGAVVWQQSVGTAGGNGLSQPNFTVNTNREVTAIYAGDLKGNIWKFDVDNADPTKWAVAFSGTPLYTGSTNQPITVMPELTFHPSGGVMVSYGTGKLVDVEDTASSGNVNLNTQAIYGIWDKPGLTAGYSGTSSLVQQSANTSLAAAADTTLSGTTTTTIDWTTKLGWYMTLQSGGERVNVNPEQINSVLLVVTNKPDANPCKSGGSSRLFALDPITGGAPSFAVFDANGVGGITTADKGYNVKSFSFGVLSLPTLQSKKPANDVITVERAGTRGQTGARLGGVEPGKNGSTDCAQWLLAGASNTSIAGLDIATCNTGTPRISWRQLK